MCLIIFDWQPKNDRQLILAANRDEFHDRPSQDAEFWTDTPNIFGGRDLRAGGTWLALSKNRRFACVTNYRAPESDNYDSSRGEIPKLFLSSKLEASEFSSKLNGQIYAGFNALLFDGHELIYFTNRQFDSNNEPKNYYEALRPGKYGLSNHLLDSPWHKIKQTKPALDKISSSMCKKTISDQLLKAMQNETLAIEADLPDTGLQKSLELLWSPAFIAGPTYGTRTCSIVILDQTEAHFHERQYEGCVSRHRNHTHKITFQST
mgnify:CR=1 FL=1